MSIQISGTTVIDQNRYIQNIQAYYGPGIATQAEAQAGTNNDQLMTPLRVKQSVQTNGLTSVINRIQRGTTSYSSTASNVPITSVNTGKTFISSSVEGAIQTVQVASGQVAYSYGGRSNCNVALSNASTLRFTSGPTIIQPSGYVAQPTAVPTSGTISWEVVEFQ